MPQNLIINDRQIGTGMPVYIVAEISANHNQSFEHAVQLIRSAKDVGADAVKLQTYTPDTMTISCSNQYFQIGEGTIWAGYDLYDLYSDAHTPWEWQPELKSLAESLDLDFFSTPFDSTAVDFLEDMNVSAYKVASFEIVDLPFIEKVAQTGKPIIMSIGMATLTEIDEAVQEIRKAGGVQLALLQCKSAYPAAPEAMNLRTIPHLSESFGVPVGLSDHTLGIAVSVAGVALGACIIEKHFTLSRDEKGPDSAFSMEPNEFKAMVEAIRTVERALGKISYEATSQEISSRVFRRSLFVVKDMKAGDVFTKENVRSIRPGYGLPPKYLKNILGCQTMRDIIAGTPLEFSFLFRK